MLAGVQSLIEESKPNAWIVSCSLLFVASIGPLLLKLFKPKEIAKRKEHRQLGGLQTPVHMEGTVDSKFKQVEGAFRANLEKGWEPSGAAIAVYHRGKLVVDLYGGYADRESRRLWRRDTMNVAFSSTKAVCALCVAVLVDRGHLAYDDPVVKYWPEFGKKGKGKITVQWVLSHMSALAYVDTPITREDTLNHERMSKIFEEQAPNWIPGDHVGYHAITYGWLVDQIIRRADPQRRSLGDFYRQEITGENDIDFHIGLDIRESYRVTRLTRPSWRQRISEYLHNPKAVNYYRYIRDFMTNGLLARVERNPEWFRFLFEMTLNNPELYAIEQGAAMGIGTARSLAKIFQKAIFEKAYFRENPKETLRKFLTPYILKEDIVTGANVARGNGMMFSEFEIDGKRQRMVGHAGYGGQNIKFDTEHELVFCYLSNGLKVGFGDSARTFVALRDAIYRSVFAIEASENGKMAHY